MVAMTVPRKVRMLQKSSRSYFSLVFRYAAEALYPDTVIRRSSERNIAELAEKYSEG
jgi:hypothetical protein